MQDTKTPKVTMESLIADYLAKFPGTRFTPQLVLDEINWEHVLGPGRTPQPKSVENCMRDLSKHGLAIRTGKRGAWFYQWGKAQPLVVSPAPPASPVPPPTPQEAPPVANKPTVPPTPPQDTTPTPKQAPRCPETPKQEAPLPDSVSELYKLFQAEMGFAKDNLVEGIKWARSLSANISKLRKTGG